MSNKGFPLTCPLFVFSWFGWLVFFLLGLVVGLGFLGLLLFSLLCLRCLLAVSWLNFRLLLPLIETSASMDHAQGRAFHHHLARALMHLNYLAGLLPFFEPSIEWEDSMPPQNFRLERAAPRSLHTFVPLPPSSMSPTMVTHGGIPSRMVENPEPNLRPTTMHPPSYMEREHLSTNPVGLHHPGLMSDPDPTPGNPSGPEPGRGKPRNTIPVQSKGSLQQLTHNPRSDRNCPTLRQLQCQWSSVTPGPLPITSEATPNAFNSDDSDGDAASTAASVHDTEVNPGHRGESTSHATIPPGTSTLTLTPNPKAPASPTYRTLQSNPMDPPRAAPFRPWTTADDQELKSMKQDTKSRPSWKTIGARLHRDPQVCKLRWGILKQTLGIFDQHGHDNPPLEPEAED